MSTPRPTTVALALVFGIGLLGLLGGAEQAKAQQYLNRAVSARPTVAARPGGVWVGPCSGGAVGDSTGDHCPDGATVEGHVPFAAMAYPTNRATDPQIAYVNFTASVNGRWLVACKVSSPGGDGVYRCDWWPGVSSGLLQQVSVGFDVYDSAGGVNQSPNGEHQLTFDPAAPSLVLPFAVESRWYVCQGYNGYHDHVGHLATALDLSADPAAIGSTGCTPNTANSSTGQVVTAPASGTVSTSDPTWGESDFVCINFDAGGSTAIGHLNGQPGKGSRVSAGDQVGILNPPQPNTDQGGYAHIHIQVFPVPDCVGDPVPFDTAHHAAFQCVGDLTNDSTANEWSGSTLTRCTL